LHDKGILESLGINLFNINYLRAGRWRLPAREPTLNPERLITGNGFYWERAMLSSIMIACTVAFVVAAIIGHVALLQAIMAPAKTR